MTTHRIYGVTFTSATDGTVWCSCGVETTVAEYAAHRKAAGAGPRGGNALGPPAEAPEHIVIGRQRGARNRPR